MPDRGSLLNRLSPYTRAKFATHPALRDPVKVEELAKLDRKQLHEIVGRLNRGVTWDGAFVGLEEAADTDDPLPNLEWRDVELLLTNPVNSEVYSDSLNGESMDRLTEDLTEYGQQVPLDISPAGIPLDGNRRVAGLKRAGKRKALCRIAIDHEPTREELEDYIFRSDSTTRDKSLKERVVYYELAHRVLQRRHGRPHGDQGRDPRIEDLAWSAKKVRDEAARRAGFSSYEPYRMVKAVLESGDQSLIAKLLAGEVGVSKAYESLRPREDEGGKGEDEQHHDSKPDEGEGEDDQAEDNEETDEPEDSEDEAEEGDDEEEPDEEEPDEEGDPVEAALGVLRRLDDAQVRAAVRSLAAETGDALWIAADGIVALATLFSSRFARLARQRPTDAIKLRRWLVNEMDKALEPRSPRS